jgi:hypothetical protein
MISCPSCHAAPLEEGAPGVNNQAEVLLGYYECLVLSLSLLSMDPPREGDNEEEEEEAEGQEGDRGSRCAERY